MKKSGLIVALLSGVSMASLSTMAHAQEATEENEIVVTAQNRAQNVQDVPITMDVVGREELSNAGFSNMNDLPAIAPAVQLNQDQGQVRITVRGVGSATNDETNDTSVVVNVDGEYMNRGNVLSVAMFDMDRVEVLRGPQGTLYGRNSTGGAINFITRKPGHELAGNLSASYGNFNATRVDGGVDIPLGEQVALRLSGFYDAHDGYVEHPGHPAFGPFPAFAGGESDDNDSHGFRASLQVEPNQHFTVNLAGEVASREFTPQAFAAVDLNAPGNGPAGPGCNAPGYEQVAPLYPQTLCVPSGTSFLGNVDRSNFDAPLFGLGHTKQDTFAFRGRAAYEFSDAATLTYIGGFRHFEGDPDNLLTLPIVYRSYGFASDVDTNSHELRLNGTIGGVIYQVGGFYFQEDIYNESGFLIPTGPNGTFLSYFGRDVSSNSKSLFGQIEVPLTQTLTAVGGLRYTENERNAVYLNASPFGAGPPDPALFETGPSRKNFGDLAFLSTLNLHMTEDQTTWLAGLNYQPTENTLVYGKVSTGFKGGGFDSVGPYNPETNTAYEIGWKQNFGEGGQNLFNVSAYYYDYKDLQVSVLLDTSIGGEIFNAGAATIWGVEAESEFQIGEHGRLHGSVNYLNASYDEFLAQFNVLTVPGTGTDINGVPFGDLDPTTPGVQQPNFAGNTAPFSPEWVVTVGYDHEFNLGSGTLTASVDTMYKSSYFTDFYNYSDGEQEAYTQSNASLEYAPAGQAWTIRAFVRNIEDERPLTYGSFVSAGPDDIFNWQFGTPRTYGVRVGVDF